MYGVLFNVVTLPVSMLPNAVRTAHTKGSRSARQGARTHAQLLPCPGWVEVETRRSLLDLQVFKDVVVGNTSEMVAIYPHGATWDEFTTHQVREAVIPDPRSALHCWTSLLTE